MEKKTSTLRLIYPQWQGGNITALVPEIKNPDDASRGYFLGAQLLNFLAPDNGQKTLTVPKYDNDVALIWMDAHPDITLPGDVYAGYHAMAVTACMRLGDKKNVFTYIYRLFTSLPSTDRVSSKYIKQYSS